MFINSEHLGSFNCLFSTVDKKKRYTVELIKKMTTLTVCNRIESGKSEKVKLNSINFKSSVQNLKDGISKKIKRPVSDFGE